MVKLTNIFNELDWDFAQSKSKKDHHAIHPYPAKFISSIPRQLIETLGIGDGETVLDPFCGSGTTLAVAQELGLESVGIDLNPIACLISRVKTSGFKGCDSNSVEQIILQASKLENEDLANIDIPNVDHWFNRDVQKKINALREVLFRERNPELSDFLLLSLSRILVKVSNQDSDTRYAAVMKNHASYDVYEQFKKSTELVSKLLSVIDYEHKPSSIFNDNILEIDTSRIKKKVGLVITSPPYPNAYEYWLYHKYRMFWLNHDPIRVKSSEIGARAHFFKKDPHTSENFFHQMKETLDKCMAVSTNNVRMAFVVGRSKIRGEIIDNADIIERAAAEVGLKHTLTLKRQIKASRKSFNLSHAKIKEESIVILERKK